MAQSIITGLTGSIQLPQDSQGTYLVQEVASITVSTGAELLDTSRYGGNGYRTRVAALKDLAGTAVAFMSKGADGTNPLLVPNDPSNSGIDSSMIITFDTGCSIEFTAIIGQVSIVGEYQGLNVITFAWSKADDAAPTINWVTA